MLLTRDSLDKKWRSTPITQPNHASFLLKLYFWYVFNEGSCDKIHFQLNLVIQTSAFETDFQMGNIKSLSFENGNKNG
jgi:hypothetical protein